MGSVVARYRNSIPNIEEIHAQITPSSEHKKISTEQSTESIDSENKINLTPGAPSSRRISACCLHELKLMDIGPLPYDHSLIEEERQREIEKKLKNDI
ncbi:unnamed protein product [Auanema sp. JU1783]|nr:unnamed protein product [Auanema sp. JU1783]